MKAGEKSVNSYLWKLKHVIVVQVAAPLDSYEKSQAHQELVIYNARVRLLTVCTVGNDVIIEIQGYSLEAFTEFIQAGIRHYTRVIFKQWKIYKDNKVLPCIVFVQ